MMKILTAHSPDEPMPSISDISGLSQ